MGRTGWVATRARVGANGRVEWRCSAAVIGHSAVALLPGVSFREPRFEHLIFEQNRSRVSSHSRSVRLMNAAFLERRCVAPMVTYYAASRHLVWLADG